MTWDYEPTESCNSTVYCISLFTELASEIYPTGIVGRRIVPLMLLGFVYGGLNEIGTAGLLAYCWLRITMEKIRNSHSMGSRRTEGYHYQKIVS